MKHRKGWTPSYVEPLLPDWVWILAAGLAVGSLLVWWVW